jgi:hypothetical protein
VELKLTERLLRSSHRAATPEAADYFWMPGAPLVIEGHRLLARLWLVAERWLPDGHELLGAGGGAGLGWGNSTGARWHGAGPAKPVGGTGGAADAKPRPLVFMPLLTERASMDSFQLSYSDNDREEWPGLETALHVRGLFAHSPACRYHHEMKIDGESHEAAATTDEATEIETLSMDLLERRLARALAARRRRVSASSLVALFGGGGYEYFEARAAGGRGCSDDSTMPGKVPSRACRLQLARNARRDASGVGRGATSSARDYCTLPESFLAWSPKRFWAGVQFNGNTRGPVWFQRGRDVVIPQLLLLKDGGSHADQPSCERMAHTSPFSPSFGSGRARGVWRPNLLWFGGHPGHDDARTRIFRLHRQGLALGQEKWKRGIVLFDSKRDAKSPRLDAINMSLTSRFCWVPRGQGQGDPTRHMVAIFHGCVPVFTLGPRTSDDALPLDELLLPWPAHKGGDVAWMNTDPMLMGLAVRWIRENKPGESHEAACAGEGAGRCQPDFAQYANTHVCPHIHAGSDVNRADDPRVYEAEGLRAGHSVVWGTGECTQTTKYCEEYGMHPEPVDGNVKCTTAEDALLYAQTTLYLAKLVQPPPMPQKLCGSPSQCEKKRDHCSGAGACTCSPQLASKALSALGIGETGAGFLKKTCDAVGFFQYF